MNIEVAIPTSLIDRLDSFNLEDKIKTRAIELWSFIYYNVISNVDYSLHMYVNITRDELNRFELKLKGKRYTYSYFINLLKENELIEVNDKYSAGKFSKSYRVSLDIFKEGYKLFLLNTSKILEDRKSREFWIKKYPHLTNKINDIYDTNVQMTEYITWLDENKGKELKQKYNDKNKIVTKILTSENIVKYTFEAMKVNLKNIWIKQSNEGRLYSSITNLSSTATPFLVLNNKPIEEIDVKNCQPLLLSNILTNDKYSEDVQNGTFYDNVAEAMNITRTEAKLRLYKHVFFNDNTLASGKLFDALNLIYGDDLIKQINNIKKNTKLSTTLQKIESDIFIKATNNYSNFITKHDAILAPKEDIDKFKNILIEEFNKINLIVKFG